MSHILCTAVHSSRQFIFECWCSASCTRSRIPVVSGPIEVRLLFCFICCSIIDRNPQRLLQIKYPRTSRRTPCVRTPVVVGALLARAKLSVFGLVQSVRAIGVTMAARYSAFIRFYLVSSHLIGLKERGKSDRGRRHGVITSMLC